MATVDTKKYDRQLRLWGSHGQKKLSESRICLLGASATGTEVLKNLILPGIGEFTVVDDRKVQAADLGESFFLEEGQLGQSLAQATTQLLRELNEDVQGSHVNEDPKTLIENNKEFFKNFDVIVCSFLPESTLLSLATLVEQLDISLCIARSYGLIGYVRVYKKEHTVVETRPDFPETDLRINCPWPALLQYCLEYDVATSDRMLQGHIPFVVLLVRAIHQWKQEHQGALPKSRDDKNALKKMIEGIAQCHNGELRDNVQEAFKHVFKACQAVALSIGQKAVLEDKCAEELSGDSSSFWIIANAVSAFVRQNNGIPPLVGSIPDMTSTSESYIALQRLYRAKAMEDVAEISHAVKETLARLGRPQDEIGEEEIKLWCKNVFHVQVIRFRPLSMEYGSKEEGSRSHTGQQLLNDLGQGPAVATSLLYLLLRTADRFYSHNGRFPGGHADDDIDADLVSIKQILSTVSTEYGVTNVEIPDTYAQDLVRYGASELHTVAAIIGGVASQEVIKLVTGQFVPINNTLIYSGLRSAAAAFEL